MKYKLLIGANDFWAALQSDILAAQKKVCIQAMTFEADQVGKQVFEALKASPAPDKYLCVDNFSKLTISDHFVYGPHRLTCPEFRQEIRDTKEIFATAKNFGIKLFFTNPLGLFLYKNPHRNHKKMMLIDDHIAYIGGINFSEHNFAWHDMMLRIEDDHLAGFFGDDFAHTIEGRNQSLKASISGTDIFVLDGYRSQDMYDELFDIIRAAKKSIKVVSPYITAPFLEVIGEQANNGLDVQIISPCENNKAILKHYLQYQQTKYPFSILMYEKKMSHLKAILIDDEILLMGSSNFDFASYFLEQEICMVVRDANLVRCFKEAVLDDAIAHSSLYQPTTLLFKHHLSNGLIRLATYLCKMLARFIYKLP